MTPEEEQLIATVLEAERRRSNPEKFRARHGGPRRRRFLRVSEPPARRRNRARDHA
jgi:hypothetical protein